jgi:predicted transposase/invertase (TIGR01784 family)
VIITIAIYKFTHLSRAEVEAMLDITLKETRIYQEVKEEGIVQGRTEGIVQGRTEGIVQGRTEAQAEMLIRTVPMLVEAGFTLEQIAERLGVALETVRQMAASGT